MQYDWAGGVLACRARGLRAGTLDRMNLFRPVVRRLTYANVVATVALVLATGGTAWAALVVTGLNVKDETLTGRDVRNGSLEAWELTSAARSYLRGRTGPAGRDGRDGLTGRDGAQGPTGATGPAGSARAYGLIEWNDATSSCTIAKAKNLINCMRLSGGNYQVTATVDISDTWPMCQVFMTDYGASTTEPLTCFTGITDQAARTIRVQVTQFWNNAGSNVKLQADASFVKAMVVVP